MISGKYLATNFMAILKQGMERARLYSNFVLNEEYRRIYSLMLLYEF